MNQYNHHVVSQVKWDTVFDSRAHAVVLQERLSDWSSLLLQQEIAAVFDQLCPPEQTWRIQLLELDLGSINFHDMESELPSKIRQQLNEKLTELILHSHQHGRRIEILDEKKSAIELIRHFLYHGLLPWNHQSADGSINQILAAQLQNNREELIGLLKEFGFGAEQVRQRMAWQFSEANMIRIIEGIEPNVGGQIVLFSRELTRVQQKETVVQASSTTDFKKSLWLWVLNYLLTERGTVFNRVQFMKSSITQMAAHYNMQYDQLFELIEFAVNKLSSSLSLQPDFIITLQLLAKENQRKKKKARTSAMKDHWQQLSQILREQNLLASGGQLICDDQFLAALKQENFAEPLLTRLNQVLGFSVLVEGIVRLHPERKSQLDDLVQFYQALGSIAVSGIAASELQFILFKKVVRAWTAGHWKMIGAQTIWNELIWEVCSKKPISKTELLKRMDDGKMRFPVALQRSLGLLTNQHLSPGRKDKNAIQAKLPPKHPILPLEANKTVLEQGMMVRNAGIVLINTYLPVLLSRLGLINEDKKFISREARLSAVYYLQYVVTGIEDTEEHYLPLNKLLCGIPLSQPIKENALLAKEHKELIGAMIRAVIQHWPMIGDCSVEGFRGNWLVRDGILTEKEERWELTVDRRVYDVLLQQFPFSFSVIRYPWMDKPLYVRWPY